MSSFMRKTRLTFSMMKKRNRGKHNKPNNQPLSPNLLLSSPFPHPHPEKRVCAAGKRQGAPLGCFRSSFASIERQAAKWPSVFIGGHRRVIDAVVIFFNTSSKQPTNKGPAMGESGRRHDKHTLFTPRPFMCTNMHHPSRFYVWTNTNTHSARAPPDQTTELNREARYTGQVGCVTPAATRCEMRCS